MGNITNAERKRREKELRDEPQVLINFPYTSFKTKADWLKDVEKRWAAFREAFESVKVSHGAYYYPNKVACWLSQFNANEENMDKLMRDYYTDKSEEPCRTGKVPISIYDEIRKKN